MQNNKKKKEDGIQVLPKQLEVKERFIYVILYIKFYQTIKRYKIIIKSNTVRIIKNMFQRK